MLKVQTEFKLRLTHALAWLALFAFTGLAQEPEPTTETKQAVEMKYHAQDLPPACDALKPPSDQVTMFRLFAAGTQNYRWNGTAWVFVEPVATLYADAKFHNKVGIHYVGPTWETNYGTKVIQRLELNDPPTAVGGIQANCRLELNDPPSAVGGFGEVCSGECG